MTIPLVDWKEAPEWATCHAFQSWGEGYWGEAKPTLGVFFHNRGRWWFPNGSKYQASIHELPLGHDYRISLEERPVPEISEDSEVARLHFRIRFLETDNAVLKERVRELEAKLDDQEPQHQPQDEEGGDVRLATPASGVANS